MVLFLHIVLNDFISSLLWDGRSKPRLNIIKLKFVISFDVFVAVPEQGSVPLPYPETLSGFGISRALRPTL